MDVEKLSLRFPVPQYSANWFTNIGCFFVVVMGGSRKEYWAAHFLKIATMQKAKKI